MRTYSRKHDFLTTTYSVIPFLKMPALSKARLMEMARFLSSQTSCLLIRRFSITKTLPVPILSLKILKILKDNRHFLNKKSSSL